MTRAIEHRGPDDVGYLMLTSRDGTYRSGRESLQVETADVCLGVRRLAILDRSARGWQPMRSAAGDLFLAFNGEIFNYLELRRELQSLGHVFRTQTDTEVVLEAYAQWGPGCVKRFNGMWALSIWDQRAGRLFCSRDRFGIKPFYYRLDGDAFVFASEIKGVLAALDRRPGANEGVLSDYLLDGALCRSDETFFEGVRRLAPAHNLIVNSEQTTTTRYWDYPSESAEMRADAPQEFGELLKDAVRLRLRSDEPVGVALSGGVDSTSILSLAAREYGGVPIDTFTAVFPGERDNEGEYASLATRSVGGRHFPVEYDPGTFLDDLVAVIKSMDHPSLDAQVLPRRRIMQEASRHVKVILEGQGADEMLAGYVGRYFPAYALDELVRAARGRGSLGKLWAGCREVRRIYGRQLLGGLAQQLTPQAAPTRWLRTRWESNGLCSSDFIRRYGRRGQDRRPQPYPDRLTNLLHYDHSTAILPMLLLFGDALSMGASIESRLPFLDYRLVEMAFQLDAQQKLEGAYSKGVLKGAMAGIIPDEIRTRRDKIGFHAPINRWIVERMDTDVRPVLLSRACRERGIFDSRAMEKKLVQHQRLEVGAGTMIFRFLSAEMWFRLYVDG